MKLHPAMRWLLWPASLLYVLGVRLRALGHARGILRQRRLRGKVISVGNLTVGGTGKTSMVIWLAERLMAEGKRVGVLTRGYGGEAAFDTNGVPQSDEPWMLWMRWSLGEADRSKPRLGIGANRYQSGRALEQQGIEWFLLDDGFQHQQVARDVDIVLVDSSDPFGGGFWLPAGPLREPRSALGRADLVVITRSEHAPALEAMVRRHTSAPVFYARPEFEGLYDLRHSSPRPPFVDCRKRKLFAFCAIGNRHAFFDDLRRWRLPIVGELAFRDHHRYTREDALRLQQAAQSAGADALVCTEKDICRYLPFAEGAIPVFACRTRWQVLEGEKFWQMVNEIIRRYRGAER